MTALNVTYAASAAPYANKAGDITAALNQAFNAWMSHFDAPLGSVTIKVNFAAQPTGFVASAGPNGYVTVAQTANLRSTVMSGFGAEVATGAALSEATRTGTLNLDPGWFSTYFANPAASTVEIQRVFQHEIGHMLGIIGFTSTSSLGVYPPLFSATQFDNYLRFSGKTESFVGPNAIASYGGAIPMDYASVDHPYVPGGISLMSYLQQAKTIQPLDVAMLRDTGLPILSNQELQEHAATRLYQAAFGRAADDSGLLAHSQALLNGLSLSADANGFVTSAEFTNRYGALSDSAFVNALYQNVLHRNGDAGGIQNWTQQLANDASRGDVLIGFSESTENRVALEANPNQSYSATAEAQTERLYDTAFGRAPDPVGFAGWAKALLNGTTLQQEAASFIGSQEFANRYGASPSNGALVDALYQNTLHRAGDAAGRAGWINALNGGLSRADLVVGFSESPEHVKNVIAADTATAKTSYGATYLADASAHLGSIPVIPTASLV